MGSIWSWAKLLTVDQAASGKVIEIGDVKKSIVQGREMQKRGD